MYHILVTKLERTKSKICVLELHHLFRLLQLTLYVGYFPPPDLKCLGRSLHDTALHPVRCLLETDGLLNWRGTRLEQLARYCLAKWPQDYGGHGSLLPKGVECILRDCSASSASDTVHTPVQPGSVSEKHPRLKPQT
jgi:hypothetical protein